jgi:hypothetical protein
MTNEQRRDRQAQLERDWTADQQARPNVPPSAPPLTANAYCPVARDHRHVGWTSKDGTRRCQSCCAVLDPVTRQWQYVRAAITVHGGEQ